MYNNHVILAANDVIGKLHDHPGRLARSRDRQFKALSRKTSVKTRINVGDAKKVIEGFFKKRALTASL